MSPNTKKVVVFDLDETLGHFYSIRLLWDAIHYFITYNKINYTPGQKDFNYLMDAFSETLRPGIVEMLSDLKGKKKLNKCKGVMVYTNNRYPKNWVDLITGYFKTKLDSDIFNRVILAFKLNGVIQEKHRTSSEKKYSDFLKCCKLPDDIEVCYFDDVDYPGMRDENVYYVKVKPYFYTYTKPDIVKKLFDSVLMDNILKTEENKKIFITYVLKYLGMEKYGFGKKQLGEIRLDDIVSKRMKTHLKLFFD
jgi:hypothetical protein